MTGPQQGPDAQSAGPQQAAGAERSAGAEHAAGAEPAAGDASEGQAPTGVRRSGLRNPDKAVRGLGAGTMALEALVLLLAIQPIRVVGGDLSGAAIGAIVALAVACVVLAGMMRRPWAWHAGTVLQGLLLLSGLLHWSLFALGVMFALVWAYALHVRRVILG
ncbi:MULTISPECIES: DUF4233 domain-containing protein [unclassified Micromonospora]|uniref:DUF4233 domain-containing protein n=1 Tax=unclassified Micromonospora TaxID=2617518 RepID=UPI001B35F66A|nr:MULTISPECIES: DUF4233 domain-containing protein [unclassified Micromonospora]MBQ1045507.1 DUF4233 domain-containing protein [Micromonospora sp. C72]MBQ1058552.1 DUF4233 domain-containing protein [Micromonospora sp. C32]